MSANEEKNHCVVEVLVKKNSFASLDFGEFAFVIMDKRIKEPLRVFVGIGYDNIFLEKWCWSKFRLQPQHVTISEETFHAFKETALLLADKDRQQKTGNDDASLKMKLSGLFEKNFTPQVSLL